MKKRDIYFIVIMVFLMIMVIVLSYFYNKFNNTKLINESKELLKDIYTLDSGSYELRNGILYNNDELVNDKEYIKASGYINIDKYMNVKFKLNKDDSCISKTSLGKIKYENSNCDAEKEIDVKMIKNNNNISFETNNTLEYMVSNKDDFKGVWKKQENNSNIIINSYNEGKNYIWFKDKEGNLSKTYSFAIDCLNANNARYNSGVFYCTGSTIILDDIKWIVIKDSNTNIKLMKYLPLNKKLNFANDLNDFKWSNSIINNYLNDDFILELSDDTINKLLTIEICDDYVNKSCNDEICGGRSREEIEMNNYYCSDYTNSKIKLISYDEFNYAYLKSENKDALRGYYWSINSIESGRGSSIMYNLEYYILENIDNKIDIKPVITINK